MITGIRHILATGALLGLSACASGYVSGYDEIRQRSASQAPASAKTSTTKPEKPAQKTAAKKQQQKQPAKQAAARDFSKIRQAGGTQQAQPRRSGDASAQTTASLNQAQLNKARASASPAATPASSSAKPQPQAPAPAPAQAQVQSVAGGTVTVAPGETLFAISRRTGVELRDLIVANNLEPPYTLRSGQKLVIPAARYHIVRPGETGYSISRAYGTDLTTLARLNNLREPYGVQVGQRLRLPATPTLTNGDKPRTAVASARPATTSVASRPATTSAQTRARPAAPAAAAQKAAPAQAVASRTFAWPLNGRILSRFGPKQGGLHNDGINIAATPGATVRAAAPGVVAYAGDGLKGFGWLILIKHDDNWVTAYAHNEALLVKRGDTVRAGEPIARAGATGSVDRPQLHFEIRHGRRAVDPLKHLPPSPVS